MVQLQYLSLSLPSTRQSLAWRLFKTLFGIIRGRRDQTAGMPSRYITERRFRGWTTFGAWQARICSLYAMPSYAYLIAYVALTPGARKLDACAAVWTRAQ